MPGLSVVIPSYNHRNFIVPALQSLERQSLKDFEVVVVDDGSTDGSPEVIADFARKSSLRLTLHQQANAGAHAAINKGLALAGGEHLAILNSDDVFHRDRLERLLALVPARGPYIAFTEFEFIDRHGDLITADIHNRRWYRDLLERHRFSPGIGFTLLQGNFSISTSNFLFSRELYDLVGGFRPYRTAHDLDFLLRAIWHVEPIFVREVLLQYRLHGSNTIDANRELERRDVTELFLDYLEHATREKPANPRAPASAALPIYTDLVLRRRPLWFGPDPSSPAARRLLHEAKAAFQSSPDAYALLLETDRLNAELAGDQGPPHTPLAKGSTLVVQARFPLTIYLSIRNWRVIRPLRAMARALGLSLPRW